MEELPWEVKVGLGRTKSQRISAMVGGVIRASGERVEMEEETFRLYKTLQDFLFEAVYKNPVAKGEEGKAKDIVKKLYAYFVEHPDRLPPEYAAIREEEGIDRAVVDYIAGMSDRYCIATYQDIFLPRPWSR